MDRDTARDLMSDIPNLSAGERAVGLEDVPMAMGEVNTDFMGIYPERTWDDTKKAVAISIANNATSIAAANIAATVAASTIPVVGIPANIALRAAMPAATAGFAFLSNVMKNDRQFWLDYEQNLMELNEDTVGAGLNRGIGQAITWNSLDHDIMKGNASEVVGEMAGAMIRDVIFTSMLGAGGALFKTKILDGVKLASVMSINNGISTYNKVNGIEQNEDKAMKAAIANGVASGVAGMLFMSLMPYAMSRATSSVFDNTLFKAGSMGSELTGWSLTETYVNNNLMESMGEQANMPNISNSDAAILFGVGAMLGGTGALLGKMLNKMSSAPRIKITEEVNAKVTANGILDRVLPNIGKTFDDVAKNVSVPLSGSKAKQYAKQARILQQQGRTFDDAMDEIIESLPFEYISEENIAAILRRI